MFTIRFNSNISIVFISTKIVYYIIVVLVQFIILVYFVNVDIQKTENVSY